MKKMNLPNRLTIARFCMSMIIVILMCIPYKSWFNWTPIEIPYVGFNIIDLICCVLFILASITDTLDGNIARKQHLISDFGKFMDPLADKALVNSALIVLAVYKSLYLPAIVVVLFIIRDLAVDGLRFIAASRGEVIAANIFGKIKTVSQMVVIPFIFLNGFPFNFISVEAASIFTTVLISISCGLSLLSGGIYIYRGRKLIVNVDKSTSDKEGE